MTDASSIELNVGLIHDDTAEKELPSPRAVLLRGRGLVGLVLILAVFIIGLAAPLITRFDPTAQLANANLLQASERHYFGTDQVNRDIFSRAVYGIRVDIIVSFIAVPIGAVIGSVIGLLATLADKADLAVQRVFDILLSFPAVILAIGLTAVLGPGTKTVIIVIAVAEIPIFGRLLRSSVLRVRELPFVAAAEVIGAGRWSILRRHVLPNAAEPLIVQLALSMSVAVFLESAMSFLGIGVRPPNPSLGSVLSDSLAYLDYNPLFALGPLTFIALLVLGFQLIAQAIGASRRG
jgi:peptide/nickel transport system permease protein